MKENNIGSNIFGILFATWAISSMVLMIVFAQKDTALAALIFGQMFFIFGIVVAVIAKPRQPIGWLFVIVGLAVMVISFIVKWGYIFNININNVTINVIIPSLIIGLMISIMGAVLIHWIWDSRRKTVSYTVLSTAECAVLDYDNKKLASPVYKYSYNGNDYTYNPHVYSNIGVPKIGSIAQIHINPDNPSEAFVKTPLIQKIIMYGLLLLAIIVLSGALISIIF